MLAAGFIRKTESDCELDRQEIPGNYYSIRL